MRNQQFGFPTRSDINRTVQSQKQARCLKFRIKEEEGVYYPCNENKGADQLRSYCEADLRLFSPKKNVDFLMWRLLYGKPHQLYK